MHIDLLGTYRKYIRKYQPDRNTIKSSVIISRMEIIDPKTGWFEIFKVPEFDLDEVTGGNYEYIYKSYIRLSQLFNNTRIFR